MISFHEKRFLEITVLFVEILVTLSTPLQDIVDICSFR